MKVLILVGSYRKYGNTAQVVGLIQESLIKIAGRTEERLEVDTIFLGEQDIDACRGCRVCFDRGEDKCPLKDDLLVVKAKMQESDGVIVASPIYVDDVSGLVKTWIDRLAHVCHRPEFGGKSAYLVVTVGSSPTRHALGTLNLALSTWGYYIAGKSGFKMGALMKPEESRAHFLAQAEKIAETFFTAIHHHRYANPSFMSLMIFKIQQLSWRKVRQDRLDYQYWDKRGWIKPRREFYFPHQASRAKVALARLSGRVIARFVS
jgi:multimeric flavodoxin WrbA